MDFSIADFKMHQNDDIEVFHTALILKQSITDLCFIYLLH